MNSRLEQLELLASKDPGDPFIQYAIALEYVSSHQLEQAAEILERLMAESPDYTAGYHQAGRVYEQLDRDDEARRCYEQGIVVAERQGDAKDLDEMREALAFLD
ncbi:MAG: tetratricopeptide repeat protein [Gemmatimonadetes bacterium]|nr:tetratricopeptide repeat protein [Gemmatimonadota bacterium]